MAGSPGAGNVPVACAAFCAHAPRVLRSTLLVVLGVTVGMRAGFPAEKTGAVAAGGGAGSPELGRSFQVVQPAIPMIWIAPGTFLMSSVHGAGDDTRVTLTRGYWIGRTEVTQAQWQAVIDHIPLPSFFKGSERPVERVAFETVVIFCARLTERERAAGRLPAGYVYALPTEAQWEYACRAGSTGLFAGPLDAVAWYEANSGGQTHPVAQKEPNAWGLYDMHGNVLEWCADWFAGYPGGRVDDPRGASEGQFRVLRGGSFNAAAGMCRSSYRAWSKIFITQTSLGFRVALTPLPAASGGRAAEKRASAGSLESPKD